MRGSYHPGFPYQMKHTKVTSLLSPTSIEKIKIMHFCGFRLKQLRSFVKIDGYLLSL